MKDRWDIEVIDVLEQPELAEQHGILATPTLCYELGDRPRRVVGDLSEARRVFRILGIEIDELGEAGERRADPSQRRV